MNKRGRGGVTSTEQEEEGGGGGVPDSGEGGMASESPLPWGSTRWRETMLQQRVHTPCEMCETGAVAGMFTDGVLLREMYPDCENAWCRRGDGKFDCMRAAAAVGTGLYFKATG